MNEKKSLILMVEDEEQVLNTNCRMLRRRGYDVRTAQTAAEACHQLEEHLPDLLTAIFRNIPIQKIIPPPILLETPPRKLPILHTPIPLPI